MIGNITVTRDSEAAMRTYTKARSFELTSLGKLEGGDTILDGSLFSYLEGSQGNCILSVTSLILNKNNPTHIYKICLRPSESQLISTHLKSRLF